MKIEELFVQLQKNPNVIQEIEAEMQILINMPNLDETYKLYNSQYTGLRTYALKVIEERIKLKKRTNLSLSDEINFVKLVVSDEKATKATEVFALLGLYEWPVLFPDFFHIIIDFISTRNEIGYRILCNFLSMVNYSQEINEKRKNELKKSLGCVYKLYMQLFEDNFAKYIIPIMTESLKIIPKDFDHSIIYRKGADCPEKTVEFILEMGDSLDICNVIDLSSKLPISVGMLMYFGTLKNKSPNVPNVSQMYEYVYKGLRHNLMTFAVSLDFWVKFFGTKNKEAYVPQILIEVLSIYVTLEGEQKTEIESEVYGFMTVLVKSYPDVIFNFMNTNGDMLPRKLGIFFVKKLFDQYKTMLEKNIKTDIDFVNFRTNDTVIRGIILELCNDNSVVDLLDYLDLSDKDASKLAIRIINKFTLPDSRIKQIADKATGVSDELVVACCIKLNYIESFDGEWDSAKFIRYFYYLRKTPQHVCNYKLHYFEQFMRKSPFDRCFSILQMLGDFPKDIYEKMYNDIYIYPYEDLNCFNRDLLMYMRVQDPYIRREIDRILQDWSTYENTSSLIICTKSLISVFADGVSKSNVEGSPYESIDLLFDLLGVDDPGIVRKVSEVFCSYKNKFDVKKAVYYLLVSYNSSFVESAHLNVSAALTKCLKEPDGSEAFQAVLGDVSSECCKNLQIECLKYNTKRAQTLVRTFLQNFKGKALNCLYTNDFKVKEQNFMANIQNRDSKFEFEIDKMFFQ